MNKSNFNQVLCLHKFIKNGSTELFSKVYYRSFFILGSEFTPKMNREVEGMIPHCALKIAYPSCPVRSPHAQQGKAVLQVRHDHPNWMRAITTHAKINDGIILAKTHAEG